MFNFWKKRKTQEQEAETLDITEFKPLDNTDNLSCEEDSEEEEYVPEKNIQLLEYLLNLKKCGKATEVVVRLRSRKDVDVLVVVEDDKAKITKILMESDFYVKQAELKVDIVNRHRGKLLVLTTDKVTYEIGIIEQSEFNSLYEMNKQ